MKRNYPVLFWFCLLLVGCGAKNEKNHVNIANIDHDRILNAADSYLNAEIVTVTDMVSARSEGGRHDYYSEGDYWWPDPDNPDGPYIHRDGMTNPDNFVAHRQAMRRLSKMVPTLVAAYDITGEKKYADEAIRHVRAWFVADSTRMNPNLRYSQAIKGRNKGRSIGIIDTIHLAEVAQAIKVLEQHDALPGDVQSGLEQWFSFYLDWLTTSEFGIDEETHGNNHSTAWAVQAGVFARLTEDEAVLDSCRSLYKQHLLPDQMAKDGSFPEEIDRTKPYGYSLFNLDMMVTLVQILSDENHDLWHYHTPDGRSIGDALSFMYPYIKDKSSWPYPDDVMYFDKWPVRHPALVFGGLALEKPKYIDLWKTLNPDPATPEIVRNFPIRQPLLWVDQPGG